MACRSTAVRRSSGVFLTDALTVEQSPALREIIAEALNNQGDTPGCAWFGFFAVRRPRLRGPARWTSSLTIHILLSFTRTVPIQNWSVLVRSTFLAGSERRRPSTLRSLKAMATRGAM